MTQEYQNYLAHHGVKGQKWGVRRYQNEDGSLTAEGRKKYGVGIEELKERLEATKQKVKAEISESPSFKAIAKAHLQVERAKQAVEDSEIRKKLSLEKNRSAHRKQLEEQYKKEGMNKADAEVAAWKREKTERVLAAAGAIAVTALAVYAFRKHRTNIDAMIPKGTNLQHVTLNPNKGVTDAFYASYTKADKKKYVGMYGGFQLQRGGPKDVHIITSQASRNLNIAGARAGRKAVQELIRSDPAYASALKDAAMKKSMTSFNLPGYRNLKKALAGKAKLNDEGFNAVNTILNDPSKKGKLAASKLYAKLKENGYDGVIDTHDVYVSGYRAQRPTILFDGASSVMNKSVKTLTSKQARKKSIKYLAILGGIPVAKFIGRTYAQTKAQGFGENKVRSYLSERRLISEYKKEHPNTKLSNKQILEVQLGR